MTKAGNIVTLRACMQLMYLGGDLPKYLLFQGVEPISNFLSGPDRFDQETDQLAKLMRVWSAWKQNLEQSEKLSGIDVRFPTRELEAIVASLPGLHLPSLSSPIGGLSPIGSMFSGLAGSEIKNSDSPQGSPPAPSTDGDSPKAAANSSPPEHQGSSTASVATALPHHTGLTPHTLTGMLQRDWDWDDFFYNSHSTHNAQQRQEIHSGSGTNVGSFNTGASGNNTHGGGSHSHWGPNYSS